MAKKKVGNPNLKKNSPYARLFAAFGGRSKKR
jgi:hypothetical protein